MELLHSYGAVLYDRASAAGLSFFVFPAPPSDSEEAREWEHPDLYHMADLPLSIVSEADPLSLQHALIPMLAGLDATDVASIVTAAKRDPSSIPQMLDRLRGLFADRVGKSPAAGPLDWLIEMAEYATTAPIIPLQGSSSAFHSLASVASQLRADPGTGIARALRGAEAPILVVLSQNSTVLVKSTTPGSADYIDHNLLDELFRRSIMNVRILVKGEMPSIDT
jgi:hypothetical protein